MHCLLRQGVEIHCIGVVMTTKLLAVVAFIALSGVACTHGQEKSWNDFVKQPGTEKVKEVKAK